MRWSGAYGYWRPKWTSPQQTRQQASFSGLQDEKDHVFFIKGVVIWILWRNSHFIGVNAKFYEEFHLSAESNNRSKRRQEDYESFSSPCKTVADPGFGQGGAKNFFRDFADVAKRSRVSKANNVIFQYKRIWEFWQICSFF